MTNTEEDSKMPRIERNPVLINGKTRNLDTYFLNALAVSNFGKPYDQVKTKTNKIVRELMKDEIDLHPQMVYRKILSTFLSPAERNQIKK